MIFTSLVNLIVDIDECSTNSHSCDVNAVCSNIRGSYTCKCKAGYSGDGKTCSGIYAVFLSVSVSLVVAFCCVCLIAFLCCFCLHNKLLVVRAFEEMINPTTFPSFRQCSFV